MPYAPLRSVPVSVAPRRGPLARVLAGAWLLLHLALVAGAPVIDAGIGHADQVVAHWETEGGTNCPPSHGAEDCQICHLVGAGRAVAASGQPTLAPAESGADLPANWQAATGSLAFLDGHAPRGPPAV
jgi:hypothetical protein